MAQAALKTVDTIAGKPLSWWFFVLMIALIGLLAASTWFLIKRTDTLQLGVDAQREALLDYVKNDQRTMMDVVRQNSATLERTNGILANIERKQQ